ncbi:unnamed protein product [Amoebophrya sp. A25]|nr:unnamed protein product [Amoebophrya sp. A25]|eukprot:GSA25T00011406001.1
MPQMSINTPPEINLGGRRMTFNGYLPQDSSPSTSEDSEPADEPSPAVSQGRQQEAFITAERSRGDVKVRSSLLHGDRKKASSSSGTIGGGAPSERATHPSRGYRLCEAGPANNVPLASGSRLVDDTTCSGKMQKLVGKELDAWMMGNEGRLSSSPASVLVHQSIPNNVPEATVQQNKLFASQPNTTGYAEDGKPSKSRGRAGSNEWGSPLSASKAAINPDQVKEAYNTTLMPNHKQARRVPEAKGMKASVFASASSSSTISSGNGEFRQENYFHVPGVPLEVSSESASPPALHGLGGAPLSVRNNSVRDMSCPFQDRDGDYSSASNFSRTPSPPSGPTGPLGQICYHRTPARLFTTPTTGTVVAGSHNMALRHAHTSMVPASPVFFSSQDDDASGSSRPLDLEGTGVALESSDQRTSSMRAGASSSSSPPASRSDDALASRSDPTSSGGGGHERRIAPTSSTRRISFKDKEDSRGEIFDRLYPLALQEAEELIEQHPQLFHSRTARREWMMVLAQMPPANSRIKSLTMDLGARFLSIPKDELDMSMEYLQFRMAMSDWWKKRLIRGTKLRGDDPLQRLASQGDGQT